jgi:hypothetical protein
MKVTKVYQATTHQPLHGSSKKNLAHDPKNPLLGPSAGIQGCDKAQIEMYNLNMNSTGLTTLNKSGIFV